MPGLSPAVVSLIVSGNRDSCIEHIVLEDVPDPVYQEKMSKLLCYFKLLGLVASCIVTS